jgi:hypothetical protein
MATPLPRHVAAVSSDVDQSTPPPAGGGVPRGELRDIARIRPLVGQLSSQIQGLSGHGYDLERARRLAVILDHELGGAGEAPNLVHARNLAASIVVKLSQLLSPGGRRNDPTTPRTPASAQRWPVPSRSLRS